MSKALILTSFWSLGSKGAEDGASTKGLGIPIDNRVLTKALGGLREMRTLNMRSFYQKTSSPSLEKQIWISFGIGSKFYLSSYLRFRSQWIGPVILLEPDSSMCSCIELGMVYLWLHGDLPFGWYPAKYHFV